MRPICVPRKRHLRRPARETLIFGRVRRLAKPLAFLLIAAQLLLTVPAMASAAVTGTAPEQMSCAGMQMADQAGDHHCPCCPDGVDSMSDCLASCLLGVAAAPAISVAHITLSPDVPFIEPARLAETVSDPPLKPPPIG